MKTKLVSLFVALFASTALWAYDFKSDDLYYNILNNGEVEVTHQKQHSSDNYAGLTSITIPSSVTHDGTTYRVTSIGGSAFSGCMGLTSITIPNSVTSIEYRAFSGCMGLTSITIPNSVTSIGDEAFSGTPWYNNQPDGVVYINNVLYTYKGTMPDNTSIVVKEGTVSISPRAFRDCTGLTSITIPNSVTSIGESAFSGCTGLTSVTIPNSVTWIGSAAFKDTPWLENQSGLIYIGSVLYAYRGKMLENTSIVVKDGVTSIGDEAFSGCTGLTSVTIPNSVTSIGNYAFEGCTGLTSVTIGKSVTSIGEMAFSDCSGLMSIIVENGNKVYDSRSNCNAIIETSTNTLIQGCQTTIIPNSVTSIGICAFYGCTGLTSLTIPNSVMYVDEVAFGGCTGLTSVLIGNNSELSMDAGFFGYANLTQVTCYANVPPHLWFDRLDKDRLTEKTLYVPVSAIDKYKEADIWKDFGHIVPIGATATDTDEPVIMPSYTEVTIAWPTTIGAKTYTITITKDGKTISSLTFDDTGVLINAVFAVPSYNGNARQAPAAQYAQSAFWFTFSGLECNTQYEYSIVAKSSNGQPISTYNGTFRTTAPTAIDNVSSSSSNNAAVQTRKVFRNGQVLIQHNGKTYTISGNEVK